MADETAERPQRRLVTTAEAARAVDIDRSTLSRWATAGVVTPARRTVGGHMRWDVEQLERQLAELQAKDHVNHTVETGVTKTSPNSSYSVLNSNARIRIDGPTDAGP